MVRKNQTSKEFNRRYDSIPYLDNAKLFYFRTIQNGFRLSRVPYESFIMESQMTRNRQNGEIQITGFAPTRLIISVFRLLIGQLK